MTTKTSMTVARALAELKTIESRIEKATRAQFVAYKVGNSIPKSALSVAEFSEKAKRDIDSVMGLIERRNAIKDALIASNAQTIVNIGGVDMTVASAIEKRKSIGLTEMLILNLESQVNVIRSAVDSHNNAVNARIDTLIEANLTGVQDVNKNAFDAITKPYLAQHGANIVDSINSSALIESLTKDVQDFKTNVDYVLSESNALTKIEV